MAWESPNGVLRWQERHRMCVSTSRKGDGMDCPIINSNAEQRPGQLKRKAERLRDPMEPEGIGDRESVMGGRPLEA